MPHYDYVCDDCNIVKEIKHSILENPVIECEKCKKPMRRKISSSINFILKGDGFYAQLKKDKESEKCLKKVQSL